MVDREPTRAQAHRRRVTFGIGWALAGTCPGAVVAMAAEGRANALRAIAGIGAGVLLRDTAQPHRDAAAVEAPASPAQVAGA